MKKIKALLILALALTLVGCDTTNPAVVDDSPPIQVNLASSNFTTVSPLPVGVDNVTIKAKNEAGSIIVLRADNLTGALISITQSHHEIHIGESFSLYDVNDIAGSGNRTLTIYTPNASMGYVHLVFDVESEAEADFELYEGSVLSNNGTALTPYNRNRTSSNTALTVIEHTPTITSLGTLLAQRHWGSGRGVGGGDRGTDEWILQANTRYLIRVTNSVASANHYSLKMVWYLE